MSPNDEIERLSRSLKSLEPIRLHEEISRVTELSRLASTRIAEVVRVNQQHWQHMIDQTTAVSRMTDLPYIHRTWLRNLNRDFRVRLTGAVCQWGKDPPM